MNAQSELAFEGLAVVSCVAVFSPANMFMVGWYLLSMSEWPVWIIFN